MRCAIISRQLGQGRQRSGGSPLFMINHRSSYILSYVRRGLCDPPFFFLRRALCAVQSSCTVLFRCARPTHALHASSIYMKNPRCIVHVGLRCARPNYILSIRTTSDKVRMRQMFHVKTWRRCSAHYVYAIAKKEKGSEIDASPQLPISTGVQSLERSRLPWSVPLDRSRLPRSAIMAVRVRSSPEY